MRLKKYFWSVSFYHLYYPEGTVLKVSFTAGENKMLRLVKSMSLIKEEVSATHPTPTLLLPHHTLSNR